MLTNSVSYSFCLLFLALLLTISSPARALNCGDYIYGDITLKADLHCSSGSAAIEVSASNLTIDLNGFTLSGNADLVGIRTIDFQNLTVKNGSIKGFWGGVNSTKSDGLKVEKITFYDVGSGVIITAGNNAVVENNDFIRTSSYAIKISAHKKAVSANNNKIINNEFFQTRTAVYICGGRAEGNQFSDNLIWKPNDNAISLNHADRNKIVGNRILESTDFAAIRLNNASYNTISGNVLMSGERVGLSILANAGDPCFDLERYRSLKNQIIDNQFWNFPTAVTLGLGVGSPHDVEGNRVDRNRINNSDTGIFLNADTRDNYGNNAYFDTVNEVTDLGVSNFD